VLGAVNRLGHVTVDDGLWKRVVPSRCPCWVIKYYLGILQVLVNVEHCIYYASQHVLATLTAVVVCRNVPQAFMNSDRVVGPDL